MRASSLHRRESVRGFTLTELLTVMLIIGIMSAVAVPQIARYIRNYRMKGGQDQVATEITTARNKGIMKNVQFGSVFVILDKKTFQYVVEDIPLQHTRCSTGETAPCTYERLAQPAQHGATQVLPQDIEFVTGTDSLCKHDDGSTPFVGNNSGMRFDKLGAWCNPTAGNAKCPELDPQFLANSVMAIVGAASTQNTFGAWVCLKDIRTNVHKAVIVNSGGRVKKT